MKPPHLNSNLSTKLLSGSLLVRAVISSTKLLVLKLGKKYLKLVGNCDGIEKQIAVKYRVFKKLNLQNASKMQRFENCFLFFSTLDGFSIDMTVVFLRQIYRSAKC